MGMGEWTYAILGCWGRIGESKFEIGNLKIDGPTQRRQDGK
jgi:hypothetical protein